MKIDENYTNEPVIHLRQLYDLYDYGFSIEDIIDTYPEHKEIILRHFIERHIRHSAPFDWFGFIFGTVIVISGIGIIYYNMFS